MNSESQRAGSVASVVLLAVATAVWGIYNLGGLESSRPPEIASLPQAAAGAQKVAARLWQDPFEAVQTVKSNEVVRELSQVFASMPTVFFGVMLEGTSYPEDAEVRRRMRYAVELALLSSGLAPEDRSHIGAAWLGAASDQSTPVAFETFRPAAPGPNSNRVVVLWLREEEFAGNPNRQLGNLISELWQSQDTRRDFVLLGPRSSDTLRRMAETSEGVAFGPLPGRFLLLSPEATAPDSLLIACGEDSIVRSNLARALKRNVGQEEFEFRNWIVPDDWLARAIAGELTSRFRNLAGGLSNHVVMISEADTSYGRALPVLVSNALATGAGEARRVCVSQYNYLRGLEGIKPQPARPEPEVEALVSAEQTIASVLKKRSQLQDETRAEGEAQRDYAWQLGRWLKGRDAELRRKQEGRIAAVGLTGSDLYDKLVLLRALRPQLPEALFFTTDLDARLWSSPKERPYTRNLLVASAYDTRPAPGEPRPPFRDVYQAAIYKASRAAVQEVFWGLASPPPQLAAELFEIGRHGPVKLATQGVPRPARGWLGGLFLVAGLSASGGWVGWRLRLAQAGKGIGEAGGRFPWPTCLWSIGLLSWGILGVAGARLIATRPGEEPWSFTEGVSIWPTEIIRLFTVELGLWILVLARGRLQQHRWELWERYFKGAAPPPSAVVSLAAVGRGLWQQGRSYLGSLTIAGWPPPMDAGRVDASRLFEDYVLRSQTWPRYLRIIPYVLGYMVVGSLVAWLLGGTPGRLCIRGEWSWWVDTVLLFMAILVFLLVLFYALDAARLTGRMLRYLADSPTRWPRALVEKYAMERGVLPEHLDAWLDVRFAAEKTRETGLFMKYPFILLLLLLVSRLDLLENWTWPPVLSGIFAMNLVLAGACWWLVRRAARDVRRQALAALARASQAIAVSTEPVAATGTGAATPAGTYLQRLAELKQEIKDQRGGAFALWIQDPTLIALLIPTGFTGVLTLLLQFWFGRS